MYDEKKYTSRRLALQKETDKIVKQLDDFDPINDKPEKMDALFKRMSEIEAEYEELLIELNVEVLLLNVNIQLIEEGYLKDEEE